MVGVTSPRRWLALVLFLAAAYFVVGRLGLALAVPPGYASPVFPAAGLAIGVLLCRGGSLWPGVALGSLLLNLTVADSLTAQSIAIAIAIGCGAALQAAAGQRLVVAFADFPGPLDHERSIFWFLALAGPISCVISATVGVSALYLGAAIPADAVASSWYNWWVGDTLGAVVFTPIVVAWMAAPHDWKSRRAVISLPLLISFAASVAFYVLASQAHEEQIREQFDNRAERIHQTLEQELTDQLATLTAVEALYAAATDVSRAEFKAYVETLTKGGRHFQAIEWIPRVLREDRDLWQDLARQDGFPDFSIWERDGSEARVPVTERGEYFPVFFVEPLAGNRAAMGFDLNSDAARRSALVQSRDEEVMVVTAPIRLVQETELHTSILVFDPIFRDGELQGFVLGVFRVADFVVSALGTRIPEELVIVLSDDGLPEGEVLFDSRTQEDLTMHDRLGLSHVQSLEVGARRWTLTISPKAAYLAGIGPTTGLYRVFGLVVTVLLGGLLLSVTGRSVAVQRLVHERTRELEESNAQLTRATQVKSRFLANMSHEIRTPLNGVIGLTKMLLAQPLDRQGDDLARMVFTSAKDLLAIINSILDFSKLESEDMMVERVPVSLRDILRSCQVILGPRVQAKGIGFQVSVADDVPAYVLGDPTRLRQILVNLAGNAVKFTDQGDVSVSVRRVQAGNGLRFEVRDTGIGIAMEKQGALFDPFDQLDSSMARKYGGTGLGLAISQNLVRLMGSEIQVESQVGQGAVFSFQLPMSEVPADLHPPEDSVSLAAPEVGFADRHPLRILLVEDNEINQAFAIMVLRSMGYDPDTATNGSEAIEAFRRGQHDLILMDVQMPVMSGLEATRQIRAMDSVKRPRIMAVTANAFAEDREACFGAGMDDFLSKPFEPSDLAAAIQRMVVPDSPAVEQPQPRPSAVLNASRVGLLRKLNEEVTRDLLESFKPRSEELLSEIVAAANRQDADALVFSAHSLRGVAGNIGAEVLSDLLREIEDRAKEGDVDAAEARLFELKDQVRAVHDAIPSMVDHNVP